MSQDSGSQGPDHVKAQGPPPASAGSTASRPAAGCPAAYAPGSGGDPSTRDLVCATDPRTAGCYAGRFSARRTATAGPCCAGRSAACACSSGGVAAAETPTRDTLCATSPTAAARRGSDAACGHGTERAARS